MAKANLATIKNWFRTGLKPTQSQFWDTWDSFWHKDEKIPVEQIEGIIQILLDKANAADLTQHNIAADAHSALFDTKVDKIDGFGLSENNLTDELVNMIHTISDGYENDQNELIEKGFHHIENFDWHVFAQKYRWYGVLYELPEDLVIDKVTIDPAPTTVGFKRFDVIVFNNDFTFSKVVGDEGLNPAIPKIDPRTQLQLTVILVEYGTTSPTYLTKQLMYDEGLGLPTEFAVTKVGANITIGSLDWSSSGAESIKVVNPVASNVLFLDKNVTFNSLDVDTITFKVKNQSAGNWRFYLYSYNSIEGFYQGTTEIRNGRYGYDSYNTTDIQLIIVPISKILGLGEVHNTGFALTFRSATATFYFDEFALNGNFTQGPITTDCCSVAEAPVDNDYYVRRNASWFSIGTLMTAWKNAVSWITANGTASGIKSLYESNADTNAYTDAEKTKLASLETPHFKGLHLSEAALILAHPTGVSGDFADVDAGVGADVARWIWDVSDEKWVVQSGVIAGETSASIKAKYEANADTNAFTDALLAKLNSITAIFTTALKALYDTAYTHSQSAHAPSDAQKNSDINKAEIEAKLIGEITSHTHPGGGGDPNADTLTTAVSITSATLTDNAYTQEGKVVKIANGVNVINYTVNGITASFVKGGTGAITFVQGAGRTLIDLNGTLVFDGIVGSTASITSFGTVDYLYINNLT